MKALIDEAAELIGGHELYAGIDDVCAELDDAGRRGDDHCR
jgi:hypothetical protein